MCINGLIIPPRRCVQFMDERRGCSMAAIDTIYNYYLSTYGGNTVTRYDTHKKSELRSVYNNMVKVNKEAPLYKILGVQSGDVSKFAIDIKESAMNLSKAAAALSGENNILEGSFKKKVATSSSPEEVSVTYVGKDAGEEELNSSFLLEVQSLAKTQVNMGNYLDSNGHDIAPGLYSFDFENTSTAYEFQYGVSEGDTNLDVQQKLARLVNTANVGAVASIDTDEEGRSSLIIQSKETGLSETEEFLFRIIPSMDFNSQAAMKTLGIDYIARQAQNSSFLLNGNEHASLSNTFTINREFEVTLNGVSEEGKPAQIGFENDLDAIADNVGTLVESYNQAIATAEKYNNSSQHNMKLLHDITSVSRTFQSELESIGLMVQENGSIVIDRGIFDDAVNNDDHTAVFGKLTSFKNALAANASRISINPINYMNKVVVAYKNPGRGFNTPYATSMYAGMMLDRYC